MEWFVAIIFTVFICGLIWVTVEAVKHANRPKTPKGKEPSPSRAAG